MIRRWLRHFFQGWSDDRERRQHPTAPPRSVP